ncbi:DMT family transporter [Rhodococcus sp. IEGM 1305]|uniref:DMT family transporter n=1 Tax=Rhodococcus sp. IEGM 1305 TaxID=3047092 RepID=UPI0024B75C98|nr:DMT family transporter [Rhodococcus sp. IEGM 1305]MDI9947846.1 DMT family transporter [Rhodococcus sp. IEGM 1305]
MCAGLRVGTHVAGRTGHSALTTKGVVHLAGEGPRPLFSSLELYALVVVGAAAVALQQSAFQVGALQASLPATTVMEPLVASLLGEYLDADRKVTAVLVVALIAVIMAAVALARGAAVVEDAGTDPAQPLSRSRR